MVFKGWWDIYLLARNQSRRDVTGTNAGQPDRLVLRKDQKQVLKSTWNEGFVESPVQDLQVLLYTGRHIQGQVTVAS